MKIRSRLLLLILPTVLAVILSISCLCYFTWYHETLDYFKESLEAIVVSSSEIIDAEGHEWIAKHKKDPHITESKQYQKYAKALKNVRQRLPVTSLYTIKIEPVKQGEPVLLDEPVSQKNRIYDGKDPHLAWRQVYIVDTGSFNNEPFRKPGDMDFSEAGEAKVYTTKQPFVTPIYVSTSSGMRFMTGFAPLLNENGDVTGLVAADLSLEVLDRKAHEIQGFIFVGALLTVILIMVSLAFVANNISGHVEKLKNAALILASGNYGKKIEVQGPQEITELANTLNTMSECLREHITRLEESSLLREKMVGEVESMRILENKLLQGVIDQFKHPEIALKAIRRSIRTPHKTIMLEILENKEHQVKIGLKEANSIGFDGIYELMQGKKINTFIEISLLKQENGWHFEQKRGNMPSAIIWRTNTSELVHTKNTLTLKEGDFVILVNQTLEERIRHMDTLQHWFTRVFRHFAEEGLEACAQLLNNELAFISHKCDLKEPLQAVFIHLHKKDSHYDPT